MIKTNKEITSSSISIRELIEYKGLKDYRGVRGFENLMQLLKADIQHLFLEHTSKRSKKKEKAQRFNSIISPYKLYWDEWTKSNFCCLTEIEIKAVNYYKTYHSHKPMAKELNIPYSQIYSHFRNAIKTLELKQTLKDVQEWDSKRNITPQQKLLGTPIISLRNIMSSKLCFALSRVENTIKEIIENHTVKQLLQYRGIGATSIKEFKTILKNYNCLELLKEK